MISFVFLPAFKLQNILILNHLLVFSIFKKQPLSLIIYENKFLYFCQINKVKSFACSEAFLFLPP